MTPQLKQTCRMNTNRLYESNIQTELLYELAIHTDIGVSL